MSGFRLGKVSLQRLSSVHPDLVRVCSLAIELSPVDFTVTEGLRTIDRQKELVAKGFSKTFQSKHLMQLDGFAHAYDVVAVGDLNKDGYIDAQDKALTWDPSVYEQIAQATYRAAYDLGVKIRWGGDFKGWFDGPHFELVP